jgi:hypothetical protein
VHRDVGCLLDRLHGEIAGRLEDDSALPADPGNKRRPVFVIMLPAWLVLLVTAMCAAPNDLLPPPFACPLLPAV